MNPSDKENMKIVEDILTKVFTFGMLVARVASGRITPAETTIETVKKEVNFARTLAVGAAKATVREEKSPAS